MHFYCHVFFTFFVESLYFYPNLFSFIRKVSNFYLKGEKRKHNNNHLPYFPFIRRHFQCGQCLVWSFVRNTQLYCDLPAPLVYYDLCRFFFKHKSLPCLRISHWNVASSNCIKLSVRLIYYKLGFCQPLGWKNWSIFFLWIFLSNWKKICKKVWISRKKYSHKKW